MVRGFTKPNSQGEKTIYASLHNRFDIEVVDTNTGKVKQRAVGHNTICNQLWTRLFAPNSYFNAIHYGSGSGTPSSSDTSLFSFISSDYIVSPTITADIPNGVYYIKTQVQLSPSTAVGKTITEVGIGYSLSSSTLCTHAMLKDMNGNPISIQKTDTDAINIYATVYLHFDPAGYSNGGIWIVEEEWGSVSSTNQGTYPYGLIPWMLGKYYNTDQILGYWGSEGNWTDSNTNDSGRYSKNQLSFNSANRTLTVTCNRMETGYSNIGGVLMLILHRTRGSSSNRYKFHPAVVVLPGTDWFPYSQISNEAVGTGDGSRSDFALDFPFAHNHIAYVNGEPVDSSLDYCTNSTTFLNVARWINPKSTEDKLIPWTTNNRSLRTHFFNVAYEVGVSTLYGYNASSEIFYSDDLVNWNLLGSGSTIQVPEEHRHHKYWKSSNGFSATVGAFPSTFTGKVLHFPSPPPAGATIVVDYQTDCIAKDANHVFDLKLVFQFGEYTEAQ